MAARKIGALIVFERREGLRNYVENGIALDALVSFDLLLNLFTPDTPLHDGAVIVQGDRAAAAACFLPLTSNPELSNEVGSRHRAALGISEETDAVAVVVSEETGRISLAVGGRLEHDLDARRLRARLHELLVADLDRRAPRGARGGGVTERAQPLGTAPARAVRGDPGLVLRLGRQARAALREADRRRGHLQPAARPDPARPGADGEGPAARPRPPHPRTWRRSWSTSWSTLAGTEPGTVDLHLGARERAAPRGGRRRLGRAQHAAPAGRPRGAAPAAGAGAHRRRAGRPARCRTSPTVAAAEPRPWPDRRA